MHLVLLCFYKCQIGGDISLHKVQSICCLQQVKAVSIVTHNSRDCVPGKITYCLLGELENVKNRKRGHQVMAVFDTDLCFLTFVKVKRPGKVATSPHLTVTWHELYSAANSFFSEQIKQLYVD